jgi:hypothetical protein
MRTIFVMGVHAATTEEGFTAFIRDFGFAYMTASDLSIPRNRRDGTAQGFALARFKSGEDAVSAVRKLDVAAYKGLNLKVCLSKTELNNKERLNPWAKYTLPEEKFAEAPKAEAPKREYKTIPDVPPRAMPEFGHGYVGHAAPKPLEYFVKLRQQWAWLNDKVQVLPVNAVADQYQERKAAGIRARMAKAA